MLACGGGFQRPGAGAVYLQYGSFIQLGGNLTISDSKASNQGGAGSLWSELDVFFRALCKRLRSNVAAFCARATRRGLLI